MTIPNNLSMLSRFQEAGGQVKLVEALGKQFLINGDKVISEILAEKVVLTETMPGETIIEQGGTDTDLYLIISGSVEIKINGRVVATRTAGNHIGELAVVDLTVRRSASVTTLEPSVFGKLTAADFTAVAEIYPRLWRAVAIEVGNRLRERSRHIRVPHSQPVLFIGSSSERLEIARAIQSNLAFDQMVATVWTDRIFTASRTTIESLISAVAEADFAVMVFSPDDQVTSRKAKSQGPRDNVLFELGLFMGGLGRERTFIVRPRGANIKIPTDLLGLTTLDYASGEDSTLPSRIAPACNELRTIIKQIGPK